jgi:hypothetical protein
MSGECDECGNHTLECLCKKQSDREVVLSFKDKINWFLNYFPNITKDEAETIEGIVNWDDETRVAFKLAKGIFEEKDDGQNSLRISND